MSDLRDKILNVKDRELKKVFVDQWGFDVYLKQTSAKEQEEFEQAIFTKDGAPATNTRAKFLAAALVDEGGEKLFTKPGDIEALSDKNGAALSFLAEELIKLNRISPEELDDLAKN